MKGVNTVVNELATAGYVSGNATSMTAEILARYYPAAKEATETKKFAEEDKAFHERSAARAEDLAETDYEMKDIEDRFVEAEVLDNVADLMEKDDALFERADATLVAVCTEAAEALLTNGLVKNADLEAVTKLIASLWETDEEEDET